jgi:branched-chain amino acid transport system ATP-binding protein
MSALLSVSGLGKTFGGHHAVENVTLDIGAGALVCILGPNGAGKTTLFNLLTKDLQPTSGTIRFEGRDVTALPPHGIARLGIGRSYQITSIFPELSVEENVWIAAYRRDHGGRLVFWRRAASYRRSETRIQTLLETVGLQHLRSVPAAALSYGDQRLLEIAITLATEPRLILLDEPTSGLSQEETRRVGRLIRALAAQITVVMIEHKIDVVMEISDRLVVMNRGRVIADGTPAVVAADEAVKAAYFGT